MSLGRPISEFGNPTCPKCGTVQESPGSTVCEQCGQDLTLSGVNKPSTRRIVTPPKQLPPAGLADVPFQLIGRIVWAISSLVYFIWRLITLTVRTAVVLLILGALVVGLSYVPEVRARAPVMNEAPRMAKQLLVYAGLAGSRWLASVASSRGAQTSQQTRTSRPAVSAPKTVPPRVAASQLLTVKSNPAGATVHLNARPVGKTPLNIKVAPGTHKVTVSRRGYSSVTRTIIVTTGKAVSVNVTLGQRQ